MRTELVTTLNVRQPKSCPNFRRRKRRSLSPSTGRPAAYLVDVKTYDALQRRLLVLQGVARGERAIERSHALTSGSQDANVPMAEIIWTEPALSDLDAIAARNFLTNNK
jgi:hypothetical protein